MLQILLSVMGTAEGLTDDTYFLSNFRKTKENRCITKLRTEGSCLTTEMQISLRLTSAPRRLCTEHKAGSARSRPALHGEKRDPSPVSLVIRTQGAEDSVRGLGTATLPAKPLKLHTEGSVKTLCSAARRSMDLLPSGRRANTMPLPPLAVTRNPAFITDRTARPLAVAITWAAGGKDGAWARGDQAERWASAPLPASCDRVISKRLG